jgi:hypothetical protein
MDVLEYVKRYTRTSYKDADKIVRNCVNTVSKELNVYKETVDDIVRTIEYQVPYDIDVSTMKLMAQQDYAYNKSLLVDKKKSMNTLIAKILESRYEAREQTSSVIDGGAGDSKDVNRFTRLLRLPASVRTDQDNKEIERLRKTACHNIVSDESDYQIMTMGGKRLCVTIENVIKSGLYNRHVPAVDVVVLLSNGTTVVYPLDEEYSTEIMDKFGHVMNWVDKSTLYPELTDLVESIQQMELNMMGRYN